MAEEKSEEKKEEGQEEKPAPAPKHQILEVQSVKVTITGGFTHG